MKERILNIQIEECSYEELSAEERRLVDEAKKMTYNSYAPYSHFHVGAAIEMAGGQIVRGANQENAAYSAGTCAERSACFYAGAVYPGVGMKRIAVAARNVAGLGDDAPFQRDPISPCGVCRQALLEYEAKYGDIEVLLYGADRIYRLPSVKSLLPLCFTEY